MDENCVCNEVRALLERMEQFPHEFLPNGRWHADFLEAFVGEEGALLYLLTVEERRVLEEKFRAVLRKWFKEKVVERIINPKQAEFDF